MLFMCICHTINPLMNTLKSQSNVPLYSSTVTGTLAVDGWSVSYIWYSEIGAWAGCGFAQSLPRCTKCNSASISGRCSNLILFDVALLYVSPND